MASENQLIGKTASELAALVRSRAVPPRRVVAAHLHHIARLDRTIGAFQLLRAERALAEADALERRADLSTLPLAGVPVAVKDNVPLQGEPLRQGSRATPAEPHAADHVVVRRLREAGAIVVGSTRVPELCIWGTTDSVFGITRNPWQLAHTAGGSSGGSAAAVAAAMVPIAHGNDGLGSLRIPAACCGLVGIKPGAAVVPADLGVSNWLGLSENGALATTVEDAALMLSVLAGRPAFARLALPAHPVRIAYSTTSPLPGVRVDRAIVAATEAVAATLSTTGHHVVRARLTYPLSAVNAISAWWLAAVAEEAAALDAQALEPRTRRHAGAGRLVRRLGLVRQADRESWRQHAARFFADCDVLLTPALATLPLRAGPWRNRPWMANLLANVRYAPFAAPWNFAGYPAMAVPAGLHARGLPLSVQLVGQEGQEALLLGVAAQLAALRPWPRHAPVSHTG